LVRARTSHGYGTLCTCRLDFSTSQKTNHLDVKCRFAAVLHFGAVVFAWPAKWFFVVQHDFLISFRGFRIYCRWSVWGRYSASSYPCIWHTTTRGFSCTVSIRRQFLNQILPTYYHTPFEIWPLAWVFHLSIAWACNPYISATLSISEPTSARVSWRE